MFKEFSSDIKEDILKKGEVAFVPAIKSIGISSQHSYTKHNILFKYYEGESDDLGDFYLTLHNGQRYEMSRLRFTAKVGQSLKLFMMELILKAAIKEASLLHVFDISVDCTDSLILESLLACKFSIRRFSSALPNTDYVFNGKRNIRSTAQSNNQ